MYKPNNKVSLKFRMKGQQRFTRGDTLSEYYTAEKLADFIEFDQKMIVQKQAVTEPVEVPKPTPTITAPKTEPAAAPKPTTTEVSKPQPTPSITTPKTEPADRVVITADEFLSGATPQDKPVTTTEPKEVPFEKEEVKVDPWEGLRNYIGKCDSIIAELKEIGFTSYDDLSFFLSIGVHEKYPQDHREGGIHKEQFTLSHESYTIQQAIKETVSRLIPKYCFPFCKILSAHTSLFVTPIGDQTIEVMCIQK